MAGGISQYQLHHSVNELHKLLGPVVGEGPSPESCADKLLGSVTPPTSIMAVNNLNKQKIINSTNTPAEFLLKYEEVKVKNRKDFEPCISFLSKLSEDKQTKDLLKRNAELRATRLIPADGDTLLAGSMSTDEVNRLKSKLLQKNASDSSLLAVQKQKEKQRGKTLQSDWISERPFQSMDFVKAGSAHHYVAIPVATSLPELLQEQAIIEDLLCCLQGLDGRYVGALQLPDALAQREFVVDSSVYQPIRDLAKDLLPICTAYSTISRFVDERAQFEFGLVNHALCAAVKQQLKDYLLLVGQLEHCFRQGELPLHRLHYYLQQPMRTMTFLATIASSLRKNSCMGASVLNILYEKTITLMGDAKSEELCVLLLQQACVPYFEMLEKWIYKGIITDPYGEFLVEQEFSEKEKIEDLYNDTYWERRHSLCRERIPVFLEKVAEKILNAGKYLNVVLRCGQIVKFPQAREIVYASNGQQYTEQIEAAHSFASQLLLDLLLKDKLLMSRLRSVKHYFLLDQGDFIVQFMDMADSELKKAKEDIKIGRLESLLDLAVRSSTANVDPHKEDLMVALLPYDLITQLFRVLTIQTKKEKKYREESTDLHLSGLESFTLDYKVHWPLSLVLNRRAIMLYQLLFRHFFYCKHVERLLCSAWMSGKSAKQHALNAVHWYAQAFALRQQMLHFIQNFQYYMMVEVVEPNWLTFEAGVKSVANVDELLSQHVDFLNSCLQDCMLTSPQLLNILHKLMAVCVTFCNYMQRLTHSALNTKDANQQPTALATLQAVSQGSDKTDQRASRKAFLDDVRYTSSDDSMASAVMTSQKNFTRLLSDLLRRIADDSTRVGECKLMNLVNRLDYNGFYTQHQQQRFDDQLDQSNMSLLAEEVGPQLRHDSATGNVESKTA